MRRSSALAILLGGVALVLGGLAGAFFTLGPALLGDCGPECVARGERRVAVALGFLALGLAALGGWLVRYGKRAWDARVREIFELRLADMRGRGQA